MFIIHCDKKVAKYLMHLYAKELNLKRNKCEHAATLTLQFTCIGFLYRKNYILYRRGKYLGDYLTPGKFRGFGPLATAKS